MNSSEVLKYIVVLILFASYYLFVFKGNTDNTPKIETVRAKQGSIAEGDDLRICSQNVFRIGDKGTETEGFYSQLEFLVNRIKEAKCSIVALQEVAGNLDQSRNIVSKLSGSLNRELKNVAFKELLGPSNDPYIRNAYIFDSSKIRVLKSRSLYHDSLPRLTSRSAPWSYVRGPLMAEFGLNSNAGKKLVLINYHLKSKSKGYKDKAGLDFELSRLLSAGGIRETIDGVMKNKSGEYVEVLLGDRNADPSSATAKVLSGELGVDRFRDSSCEIIKSGEPVCKRDNYENPSFKGVLESKNSVENLDLSTHSYRGHESILDEIYISREDFDRTLDLNGLIRAGVSGDFQKGSDHLLSWVEINLD